MDRLFPLFSGIAASDPVLLLSQSAIVVVACVLLFLLSYTLRDVMLRSHSLPFQFISILLVAVLPIAGFLLYLLIRPARTVLQRQQDGKLDALWQRFCADESADHARSHDTHTA